MAKAKQSLEEGLDRSANKKGLHGKERHRYIGGAIRNMEKRGLVTPKKRAAAPKASTATKTAHKPAPAPAPKPARAAYTKPAMVKRTKLELVVKENKAASTPLYTAYSIYKKDGTRYGTYTSRKRAAAVAEAKRIMDAHNHPLGEHKRTQF